MHAVLVINDGRPVGVISIGDIVQDMVRRMGEQVDWLQTHSRGHGA